MSTLGYEGAVITGLFPYVDYITVIQNKKINLIASFKKFGGWGGLAPFRHLNINKQDYWIDVLLQKLVFLNL